mmetsp:Transcript_17969/g.33485  ORF Transcript_17969/g.33485 Transcript_17969/m.33485 type:complete len:200 (+) Transcript_17969:356-955(+)
MEESSACFSTDPYVTMAVGSSLSGTATPICSRSSSNADSKTLFVEPSPPRAWHTEEMTEMFPNGQCSSASAPCGLVICTAVSSTPSSVAPASTTRGTNGSGSTGSVLFSPASFAASLAASASLICIVSVNNLVRSDAGGGAGLALLALPSVGGGSRAPTHAATLRWCSVGPHPLPPAASMSASMVESVAAHPGIANAGG